MRADDLADWIAELRERVERGELAELEPFDPSGGTPHMPGELVVRIMLADLDHYDDLPPLYRRQPAVEARRRALLDDLRRQREQIG